MRVYYFCPENGVYQGEGFEAEDRFDAETGVTTVAPPLYSHGEVPVFDAARKCWIIQQVVGNGPVHREQV